MKILPTSRYIRNQASLAGEVILLLGVRRSESATRAGVVARYDNGARLNPHNDLAGCFVFRPIVDLDTDEVWEFLAANAPPWGGSHRRLIQLYRDAGGGECPVITSRDDAPSCGTTSSRFGCWTCTVVEKAKRCPTRRDCDVRNVTTRSSKCPGHVHSRFLDPLQS